MALAESLDYTQTSILSVDKAGLDKTGAYLTLHADGSPHIEMHQIKTHLKWFNKAMGVPLTITLTEPAQ